MQIDYAGGCYQSYRFSLTAFDTHHPHTGIECERRPRFAKAVTKNGRITKPIPNKMILECDHPFIRRDDPPGADGIASLRPGQPPARKPVALVIAAFQPEQFQRRKLVKNDCILVCIPVAMSLSHFNIGFDYKVQARVT